MKGKKDHPDWLFQDQEDAILRCLSVTVDLPCQGLGIGKQLALYNLLEKQAKETV